MSVLVEKDEGKAQGKAFEVYLLSNDNHQRALSRGIKLAKLQIKNIFSSIFE